MNFAYYNNQLLVYERLNQSMLTKSNLINVILDQREELKNSTNIVERELKFKLTVSPRSNAVLVKGLRRCGKSTLLKQFMETNFGENFYYFNFDDDRVFGFTSDNFQLLYESMIEIYGDLQNFFLDEIQNVKGWELFINRMLRIGKKVYITGSNANLLSKEIGTHLTGRHIDMELFPFSFKEFLTSFALNVPDKDQLTTIEKGKFVEKFNQYLINGGMPEYVISGNKSTINQLVPDIIQRDIINRYSIRKTSEFKSLIIFLIENISNEISFRSISRSLNISSETTVRKYTEYISDTYLIFLLERYTKKIKTISINPKKVYCVDNGLITANSLENKGRLIENLVAVYLRRNELRIYYYKSKDSKEVDFVIPDLRVGIQVCYELNNENEKREFRGLIRAAIDLSLEKLFIITNYQEEIRVVNGYKILIIPCWKFMLFNVFL